MEAIPAPKPIGGTSFLSLPAELRNRIYRLSVVRGTFCIYTVRGRPWSTVLHLFCASKLPTGILQANRQIHCEAASILYGENVFAFPHEVHCWSHFELWLQEIGSRNRQLLAKVQILKPDITSELRMLSAFSRCREVLEKAVDLELPFDIREEDILGCLGPMGKSLQVAVTT